MGWELDFGPETTGDEAGSRETFLQWKAYASWYHKYHLVPTSACGPLGGGRTAA